ncbi:histidine kinase dimerization/phosphoacceptor domain -containing protein [Falsirhodobacter sp. alg1]|uniref:histidine kinase dimerization/phosphoacceptor domain -containing protein n=1 Tax=Falsirhodobacter sp. alg1 TaxID=1472418 RepID=UPI0006938178|nr:histidine kinase dimerization/phosphoacceptor domain -containing protein [Falsirhodobacter sp. alg1]
MSSSDIDQYVDLSACEVAPIHTPGSIQPHGLLLIADAETGAIVGVAGDVEGMIAADWAKRTLQDVLGLPDLPVVEENQRYFLDSVSGVRDTFVGQIIASDGHLIAELEAMNAGEVPAHRFLSLIEECEARFEDAGDLAPLCVQAARTFRRITGFDHVMIYRFVEDADGIVVAEDRAPHMRSYLRHQFPAADIPRQARVLYMRNKFRVIPDAAYTPVPIRSADPAIVGIDLSDVNLRSVAPIHLVYLKNMNVQASASVSIIRDGKLWGLVACHNATPRNIPMPSRLACLTVAGALSRQIGALETTDLYRARLRLRAHQDAALRKLGTRSDLGHFLADAGEDLRKMLHADGFAVVRNGALYTCGTCPPDAAIPELVIWAKSFSPLRTVSTDRLSEHCSFAKAFRAEASGMICTEALDEDETAFLWFRAEKLKQIDWAGNPHKMQTDTQSGQLSPRASFDKWSETVHGRASEWTMGEVEAAARVTQATMEALLNLRLREMNSQLNHALALNEDLLAEKDGLMREVNHRVQNSLSLVGSFLRMQARSAPAGDLRDGLMDAQRRIMAVSMVHRKLYGANGVETVDLGRYLDELVQDVLGSSDPGWSEATQLTLTPLDVSADKAVNVGLILNELMTNSQKYAYGGQPGPIRIDLSPTQQGFRLSVTDQGIGKKAGATSEGFGSSMIQALVQRIDGTITETGMEPGLRTTLTVPMSNPARI